MKSSTYFFHVKTKILIDFQICISVPLRCLRETLEPSLFSVSFQDLIFFQLMLNLEWLFYFMYVENGKRRMRNGKGKENQYISMQVLHLNRTASSKVVVA